MRLIERLRLLKVLGTAVMYKLQKDQAGSFTQAGKMRVIVNTPKLLDWAQRYEFARLSEVYSETARRLKEKQQKLLS